MTELFADRPTCLSPAARCPLGYPASSVFHPRIEALMTQKCMYFDVSEEKVIK